VESIRSFDPETQRSQQQVEKIELLPAREFPLTEEAAKDFRGNLRERFPIDVRRCPLYQDMKEGVTPGGIEYYLPLFFPQTATLFDYLADDALFVLGEGAAKPPNSSGHRPPNATTSARTTSNARCCRRRVVSATGTIARTAQQALARGSGRSDHEHAVNTGTQPAPELPLNRKGEEPGTSLRHFIASYPGRVLIAADSAGRREALIETLATAGMKPRTSTAGRLSR
jgi:transcription-repair coupling factor (superfamily II helicase)